VTGHATVAARVVSIEFRAQLLFVDSPLPTFFCFISCSVFVADSSCANAIGFADIIPVNAAAIKTVAMTIDLFIVRQVIIVIISELTSLMGDLLQYFYGVEYHNKISTKKFQIILMFVQTVHAGRQYMLQEYVKWIFMLGNRFLSFSYLKWSSQFIAYVHDDYSTNC
jgi:hypothetical protein